MVNHYMNSSDTPPARRQSRQEEVLNAASHGLGLVVACLATPLLILRALQVGDIKFLVATCIFCATMMLLYFISAFYHILQTGRAKRLFAILDHSAIFLLIAGTYTPFTLGVLQGALGWSLFGIIWGLAGIGVVLKVIQIKQHPLVSNISYLLMGWLIIFAIKPLITLVPTPGVLWLVAGGAAYSIGVIFFVLDSRIKYSHFIWHLFVLTGTVCHAIAIYWYAA